MFLVVVNDTHFYALLEGRDLVEINTIKGGVSSIGFPIQKSLNKLDAKTMFLLPKYFETVKHITIGDKNGFYHTPMGTADWQYTDTKEK